jgi:tetratricopeptide (TPR) repeat protein
LKTNAERLAAQRFNKAVEMNDRIVDAYIGLAIARKSAGDESEALATLSLAAAIDANSSLLFAQVATLQLRVELHDNSPFSDDHDSPGLIETVIAAHQQEITYQPQNPDLHYRLGVLMMSVGRMSNALKAFQTALEINSTFTRARSKLAVCLFETDREQAAVQQLTVPQCLDKDTLALHYKVALLYCDRFMFASSLLNLDRLLAENFACGNATVNISIALQNLGLLDRASAMWDNLSDTANHAISTDQP